MIIFGTACCKAVLDDTAVSDSAGGDTSTAYAGAGRVVELLGDSIHVKVKHGTIEGLMEAMELSFPLKNTDDLRLVAVGDSIQFEIVVESDGRFFLTDILPVEESRD